jgi:hypothetical protein
MALSLTCNHCKQEIVGSDEDELVALIQEHVAAHGQQHGRTHDVSRDDVLRRLSRQGAKGQADT